MIAALQNPLPQRPCLVLGHPNPAYEALISRQFRLHGWEVHRADTGPEVRRLAVARKASLVVLATDLGVESGWLTCAKLTREVPGLKVIVVDDEPTAERTRFARFAGATAVVETNEGPRAVFDHAFETTALPAVG